MIKNFIITGDTHGRVPARLDRIKAERPDLIPEETAIVILGDAGINYWLNKSDQKNKRIISGYGYTIYCVRGNHEERPENLGYEIIYDDYAQKDTFEEAESTFQQEALSLRQL